MYKLREWLQLKPEAEAHNSSYQIQDGRFCAVRVNKSGGIWINPLCNFVARVTEEDVLDDGAETTRAFVLEGMLESREPLPAVRIPAARFGGMSWVPERWGLRAIVRAGSTVHDQLREAIQHFSGDARRHRVFTHMGWREIDGGWVYLTTGRGVGAADIEVDLGAELARYRLPCVAENPRDAMRMSLRLLALAPLTVTVPLWASMFRAPLASACPADFSLWLEGPTGNLKSTIAALFLCHFGEFDRTSLPGTWSSTANQIERRAFVLKDAPFVVDDYAPGPLDGRELEAKAARVLRSQGNLSGRGRLRADLSERPAYPPRGLIIGTGEQHPPGQSLLARMLILEINRTTVDLRALSEAQRWARKLPHAMVGYLLWLAPRMATLPGLLRETLEGTRARMNAKGDHLRIPEVLAHLSLGLNCGLQYAEDIGACSRAEAEMYQTKCWEALLVAGRTHGRSVETERPSRCFLSVLTAMLTQGRAEILPRDLGGDGLPGDKLVGWGDDDSIYLVPESAFGAVARFCREAGEPFPVRQERLLRDLAREGLSECDPERYTTTARIGGRSRRVLRLRRQEVEGVLGEELPSYHQRFRGGEA